MDEPLKDEDELEEDEAGFGHDPVPKKGKSKDIILPDDDVLDTDESISLGDEPDEESLDKLAEDEDVEDSFDDEDYD